MRIWYNKADNTEGAFIGMVNDTTYGFWGNSTVGNWKMGFDVKNAQMGIGITDPTAPLSFASDIGNKIALWGDANGGHYGLGIQGSLMQLYTSASNADIAFGYGRSASFTETMRIKGAGRVGINTDPINYTLNVKNLGLGSNSLLLDNASNLFTNSENKLTFGSNNLYTGAIKSIGTSATTARLGFFTGAAGNEEFMPERMTIADGGNVGIGVVSPENKLEIKSVGGSTFYAFTTNLSGNVQAWGRIASDYSGLLRGGEFSASSFDATTATGVLGFGGTHASGNSYAVYGSSFKLTAASGLAYAGYFSGNLNYTGTLTNTSDATLKTNIKPFENALNAINQLQIKQYEYTAESKKIMSTPEGEHIGVLAQELQEVFPTLVSKQVQPIFENVKDEKGNEKRTQTGAKEYLGVNYMELIPVLIKGMQEQQLMIEELKKKIAMLEKKSN